MQGSNWRLQIIITSQKTSAEQPEVYLPNKQTRTEKPEVKGPDKPRSLGDSPVRHINVYNLRLNHLSLGVGAGHQQEPLVVGQAVAAEQLAAGLPELAEDSPSSVCLSLSGVRM